MYEFPTRNCHVSMAFQTPLTSPSILWRMRVLIRIAIAGMAWFIMAIMFWHTSAIRAVKASQASQRPLECREEQQSLYIDLEFWYMPSTGL